MRKSDFCKINAKKMSAKAKKFYVVWIGRSPGVYRSWEECKEQTFGFDGARFMAFPNEAQAVHAFRGNMWDYLNKKTPQNSSTTQEKPLMDLGAADKPQFIHESIAVDAACSGNPGAMEYQGVYTKNGRRIFYAGPFPDGTNNVGEFLALVHALALLKEKGKAMPVYSDSETAMAWVRNKKAKTKLEPNKANAKLFELIQRAEYWLKNNTWESPILKWKTEIWGEIPADFGRK